MTSLAKVLFSLLAILFVAEVISMFILPLLRLPKNTVVENFTDAFILVILCAPFVWRLISGRKRTKEKLAASDDSRRAAMNINTKYGERSSLTSLLKVIFSLLAILFVAETIIMFILPILHLHENTAVENFADALMLAILCAPFIWMLISGRQQAEEELAASEDSLRLIYNSVYDAIFIHDLNGDIIDVNDKMLEMYRVNRDQALTLSIKDDYSSRDNPLGQFQHLWERARAGENQFFEWKAHRPDDGSQFDVEMSLRKISIKGKDVILATVRDITTRKQTEQALQSERQRLFSVLENLPGFVCLKAPDYSLSFTNRYFRECFGEVEGRLCYQVIRDRQEPCDPCPTLEVFAKRELKVWEWDGGDSRIYQVYDYPFTDIDGSPLVLGLGIDISEQKHTEQELRESRAELITQHEALQDIHLQLERKSLDLETAYAELKATQSQMLQREKMASIGQLAAGVAHEINNPMGFISSNLVTLGKYTERLIDFVNAQSEILQSTPYPVEKFAGLEEQRRKIKLDYIIKDAPHLIEESLDGAGRVRKIVQSLKTFSRVDESKRKQVDINECLDSTINIAWNEIKYVATLKKEYGEIPPFLCYPQQLNQVFMNLVVNAVHAIEDQGEITVRTWCDDDHVWVAISDTGTGIPEEIRTRIFEPFFTTKEVGKGTGLGLSISYDIVKKHDGEILVESEGGKGTTFTLKLPVARE